MWLFTTIGFFSATQVQEKPEVLQIRARVKGDLDNLRTKYLPKLSETVQIPGRDYPYRAYTDRPSLAAAMVQIISDLSYANFKSEVVRTQGLEREQMYHDVWNVMYDAERKLEERVKKNKTRNSAFDSVWSSYRSSVDDSGLIDFDLRGQPVSRSKLASEAQNAAETQEFLAKEGATKRPKKGGKSSPARRRTR